MSKPLRLFRNLLPFIAATLLVGAAWPAQAKPLARPEPIEIRGQYTQPISGMIFPPSVGEFRRVSVLRYDTEESDVSAGYNLAAFAGGIVATVYAYPAPSLISINSPPSVVADARATLCEREFASKKREVTTFHPDAVLIQEKDITLAQGGPPYPGKQATYEFIEPFLGRRQPLRSELYVFCYVGEKWALEYRFTFPKSFDGGGQVAAFMQSLRWTITP